MEESVLHLDDMSPSEVKAITLEDYDKLNVSDRSRLAAECPEVFHRLMCDRETQREVTARAHSADLERWSRTPHNQIQKRKPQPQRPLEPSFRQSRQKPTLEKMSADEIRSMSVKAFDELEYTDRLRMFDEFPEVYAKLRRESLIQSDRQHRGW